MVRIDHKQSQFMEPLFEYSGACAGCGETPYLKLLTQLFGDRLLIANATGCSSIYGGNLPTHAVHDESRRTGPGVVELALRGQRGVRLRVPDGARRPRRDRARPAADARAAGGRRSGDGDARCGSDERGRHRRTAPPGRGASRAGSPVLPSPEARRLETLADYLVKKSVWLVGGDGWAYDIGYGGLDHVLANRRDVNILVMDTEVYSNTGGQASKATPLGAAAKFAAAGKPIGKKDLGLLANMYGHVYVAKVAFGAKMAQTAQAFLEAESYRGSVVDHRLQPLHRPRLRHGARRVAAEARRRHRRVAALPVRSAPAGERRTAAEARLRAAQRDRSPTTCGTSRASGRWNAPIPRCTSRSSPSLRRPPSAATPCISSSPASPCR